MYWWVMFLQKGDLLLQVLLLLLMLLQHLPHVLYSVQT
jgi:hypothetical protein